MDQIWALEDEVMGKAMELAGGKPDFVSTFLLPAVSLTGLDKKDQIHRLELKLASLNKLLQNKHCPLNITSPGENPIQMDDRKHTVIPSSSNTGSRTCVIAWKDAPHSRVSWISWSSIKYLNIHFWRSETLDWAGHHGKSKHLASNFGHNLSKHEDTVPWLSGLEKLSVVEIVYQIISLKPILCPTSRRPVASKIPSQSFQIVNTLAWFSATRLGPCRAEPGRSLSNAGAGSECECADDSEVGPDCGWPKVDDIPKQISLPEVTPTLKQHASIYGIELSW